jgi:hypothetical protein
MFSGFLSSGHLCLIHHLKKIYLMQSQWPPTEKVLKFNMSLHDCVKKSFSKTSKEIDNSPQKLNSRTWKTLKSSIVILQALETSAASLTSAASATSLASTGFKAQFPQKTY